MITARQPCAHCAKKHLCQAMVLLDESMNGYPEHRWLAMGHVAEAESEIAGLYADIAGTLREARKTMDDDRSYVPDFLPVVVEIDERSGPSKGCDGGCGGSCQTASGRSLMTRRGTRK